MIAPGKTKHIANVVGVDDSVDPQICTFFIGRTGPSAPTENKINSHLQTTIYYYFELANTKSSLEYSSGFNPSFVFI